MPVWQRGEFFISTERPRLDLGMIQRFLARESYWAQGQAPDVLIRSIENSAMCFAVYDGDPQVGTAQQVGFARLVSDKATFAWVCDVFVIPTHRGRGLGKWLVEVVVETTRAWGVPRVVLATRDAQTLYGRYGFETLPAPERWMILSQT